ncbi:hypothetical protein KC19_VG205500 [Ceratodon purpureus]|uniref:Uncharacterized protein n=1 Tax=Ceratodon purpureus TaxID=3225 RepID=A0A8T0HSJ4_CERPU|nr:hypothetical protein KC19_VG205500 [Ceratodon purpureus]
MISNLQRPQGFSQGSSIEAHALEDFIGEDPSFYMISEEGIEAAFAALSLDSATDQDLILDSGASRHFANDPNLFRTLDQGSSQGVVTSASRQDHVIKGTGNI